MPVPRAARARLAPVLVACLASMPVARGQVSQEAAAPGDVRLKLRMQEKLLPPVAPGTTEDLPIFLEADRIEGYQDRELEAIGSVVVRRRGQVLYTDRLKYSIQDNAVTAKGNVRVDRLGDVVTGDEAYYDLDDSSGYIDHPTYRFREFGARGEARRLLILDRDTYRAERATYTNCDVGDDDWYLRVDRLDLDRLRDVGVARHTTVYFKGLPVLYSPWIDFPLTSRRKTGFLPPTIGTTNNSGFEFTLPFYWNMAPNRDYTLAPRLLSRRGLLLNNEFRYLEPKFNGEARFGYLPDDRIKEESRWGYSFQHDHRITERLSGNLNLQGVSDDTYFVDLSDQIAATSQTNLPREGTLTYNGEWWTLFGRAQTFQTLQDPQAPVDEPYNRLPQLLLQAARHNVRGFDLDFSGEVVNFDHSSLVHGWRQVYYPSVRLPYRNRLFYLTPEAGFHYTYYSFPDSDQPDETRSLPIFTVDSGMSFERDTLLGRRRFRQTLEPRVYYVYIPFRSQDQLPLYDTAEADFNLPRIFYWNQFSGSDRINDANQITAAVTSRLLNPDSGSEWIRGTLGQRYYFTQQQVTLGNQPPASNRSDLLAQVYGSLTRAWSAHFGLQFNVDDSQSERVYAGVRYRPQAGQVLNIGYRFTRDQLEQLDLSAQWPLSRRWNGLARWNYSLQDNSLLEGLLGFEYNAACWSARVVAHRFVTSVDEYSTSLLFQLELSGLSRVGNNPLQVLRQNIGGYTPAPRRRAPTEDYYPGMENP